MIQEERKKERTQRTKPTTEERKRKEKKRKVNLDCFLEDFLDSFASSFSFSFASTCSSSFPFNGSSRADKEGAAVSAPLTDSAVAAASVANSIPALSSPSFMSLSSPPNPPLI